MPLRRFALNLRTRVAIIILLRMVALAMENLRLFSSLLFQPGPAALCQ